MSNNYQRAAATVASALVGPSSCPPPIKSVTQCNLSANQIYQRFLIRMRNESEITEFSGLAVKWRMRRTKDRKMTLIDGYYG